MTRSDRKVAAGIVALVLVSSVAATAHQLPALIGRAFARFGSTDFVNVWRDGNDILPAREAAAWHVAAGIGVCNVNQKAPSGAWHMAMDLSHAALEMDTPCGYLSVLWTATGSRQILVPDIDDMRAGPFQPATVSSSLHGSSGSGFMYEGLLGLNVCDDCPDRPIAQYATGGFAFAGGGLRVYPSGLTSYRFSTSGWRSSICTSDVKVPPGRWRVAPDLSWAVLDVTEPSCGVTSVTWNAAGPLRVGSGYLYRDATIASSGGLLGSGRLYEGVYPAAS